MFKSECPRHLKGALVGLYLVVSDAINSEMLQPFTLVDINVDVHELRGLKTAGRNSFHGMFYQHCWDTINNILASVVFEFFDQGSLPPILNSTNLVLIPKVLNSEQISQFRPISLCNFSYKVSSKLLVNRCKNPPSWTYFSSSKCFRSRLPNSR